MATTLPILATRLQFAYNEPEDRLTLVAVDAKAQGVHVALTRRMTDRLINGLARLLEQSSAVAVQAPAELRADIILMEHQDALYGHEEAGQASASPEDRPGAVIPNFPAPRLATTIDVTVTPTTFEMRVRDEKVPLIALSLTRLEVHRVVETLSQRAEAAGWNIAVDATWLELGQTEIVFN